MPIRPAQLASSLGALGTLDVERELAGTLQQVLRSAKMLFDAARVGLMLVDEDGALGWASSSDGMEEARSGDLAVPVHVGGGPVGTLDVYVTAPRRAGTTVRWPPCTPTPGWSRACLWPR